MLIGSPVLSVVVVVVVKKHRRPYEHGKSEIDLFFDGFVRNASRADLTKMAENIFRL